MINGSNSCYPNVQLGPPTCTIHEGMVSSSYEESSASLETHTNSFLCNLSILKEKVHQVQSLASMFMCEDRSQNPEYSKAIAMPAMGTLIQEIIVTASSLMFTCQQMTLGSSSTNNNTNSLQHEHGKLGYEYNSHVVEFGDDSQQGFYSKESLDRYANDYYNFDTHRRTSSDDRVLSQIKISESATVEHGNDFPSREERNETSQVISPNHNEIFELDAADLLAKFTHYCQVCGKGFKRDANLRMHMRAHGDEYKSNAALSNPMKNNNQENSQNDCSSKLPRKYSCPQEGCRWNKKHAKFQPLKSMICVKNHYKRSHCPKMYVCKRCNRKQFSLLSDLRTHEKHCGDNSKWLCSCGTTFSRKDKLMGHVALFIGHTPMVSNSLTMMKESGQSSGQIQLDER